MCGGATRITRATGLEYLATMARVVMASSAPFSIR
jgi:hypothetical protein